MEILLKSLSSVAKILEIDEWFTFPSGEAEVTKIRKRQYYLSARVSLLLILVSAKDQVLLRRVIRTALVNTLCLTQDEAFEKRVWDAEK